MTDTAVRRVVSDIIRSPEDKRVYRGLEFTNGLKAMLISDPTTDKSSAALDVHIGNLFSISFLGKTGKKAKLNCSKHCLL